MKESTRATHERKILHIDLDAFYCAVEEQRDPTLRGKPFAVGGRPESRGVVASCSYAARRFGIRSAMPMARAVRVCRGLIIVSPHRDAYRSASRQVMTRLYDLTPLVEQVSIDEAFLDVSHLDEPGEMLARRLQARINHELQLPCSLGVATNKLIAKIANNIGKASVQRDSPPNAIHVVPPGQEAAFLDPLPVGQLWGVGPKTAERLVQLGIHTIGELARWGEDALIRRFGKHGHDLALRSRGIDDRPVETEFETKSVSQETTFARDVTDGVVLQKTLRKLSEQVGQRLRRKGLSGMTVKIKLRWSDFTTLTRQMTLTHAIHRDMEIYTAATQLFEKVWPPGKPVRLIGVGVTGFEKPPALQLSMWDTGLEVDHRLHTSLNEIRKRFGDKAIQRGSQMSNEESPEEPSELDK